MRNFATLGEISDVVTKLSLKQVLKFVGKWWLIIEAAKFIIALVFITFLTLVYPQKILDFTQHGILPWEEVER